MSSGVNMPTQPTCGSVSCTRGFETCSGPASTVSSVRAHAASMIANAKTTAPRTDGAVAVEKRAELFARKIIDRLLKKLYTTLIRRAGDIRLNLCRKSAERRLATAALRG